MLAIALDDFSVSFSLNALAFPTVSIMMLCLT